MDALTKGNARLVLVVDTDDRLLGTLSDGDLRRFVLAGNELSSSIQGAFNQNPTCVQVDSFSKQDLRRLFQEKSVTLIPVVDNEGRVVDHVSWEEAFEGDEKKAEDIRDVPIVIMAGGQGTRLKPFTHVLPKPLIPIDGKPIIEHIMDRFRDAGGTSFYVTVNHKARILRAYLENGDGARDIAFVEEEMALGTAGALRLLAGRFNEPAIVSNCDVLVAVNYRELMDFHVASGCSITMVASAQSYRVPYGACSINDDGTLRGIEEKPELAMLANTGLYIVNPSVFDRIPEDEVYHMTNLIADLMQGDDSVAVFPVSSEAWVDIGQWEEYRRAARLMRGTIGPEDES